MTSSRPMEGTLAAIGGAFRYKSACIFRSTLIATGD